MTAPRRTWMWVEFLLIFVGIPLLYVLGVRPPDAALLPLMAAATVASVVYLYRQPDFDRRNLWRRDHLSRHVLSMLPWLAIGLVALPLLAWTLTPKTFFVLPRERPVLWLVILAVYPILSVIPQEIIWRAFLFHRYRAILPTPWARIIAGAIVFAWLHIIFMNAVAVTLTLIGGLLFGYRYHKSQSLLITCIEHTLWGSLIFTTGLGIYFIHGTLALVLHVAR